MIFSSRLRKHLAIAGVFLGACAILLFWVGFNGIGPLDYGPAARELDHAVAEYRSTGLPWEAKDLRPNPPVKPEENAAPILAEAFKTFNAKTFSTKRALTTNMVRSAQWPQLSRWLAPYQPTLKLARQAATKPKYYVERDYDLGMYVEFPDIKATRDIVLLFTLSAILKASNNDASGCCSDLTCAWRLSDFIGQEPDFYCMLLETSAKEAILSSVQQCAGLFHANGLALQQLDYSFSRMSKMPDLAFALRSECYTRLATLRNLEQLNMHADIMGIGSNSENGDYPTVDPSKLSRSGLPRGLIARAFTTRLLQYWTKVFQQIKLHPGDREATERAFKRISEGARNQGGFSNLDGYLEPTMDSAPSMGTRLEAVRETTHALVAALEVKVRTGRFPKRIQDVPRNWIDPFNQQSLKLTTSNEKITIYSVAQDQIDNGGAVGHGNRGGPGNDIVASYPPIRFGR